MVSNSELTKTIRPILFLNMPNRRNISYLPVPWCRLGLRMNLSGHWYRDLKILRNCVNRNQAKEIFRIRWLGYLRIWIFETWSCRPCYTNTSSISDHWSDQDKDVSTVDIVSCSCSWLSKDLLTQILRQHKPSSPKKMLWVLTKFFWFRKWKK